MIAVLGYAAVIGLVALLLWTGIGIGNFMSGGED